jgi:hypothetical protein
MASTMTASTENAFFDGGSSPPASPHSGMIPQDTPPATPITSESTSTPIMCVHGTCSSGANEGRRIGATQATRARQQSGRGDSNGYRNG